MPQSCTTTRTTGYSFQPLGLSST